MREAVTIAMVVDNYFEQSEMTDVRERLIEAGFKVDLISTNLSEVTGLEGDIAPADVFQTDGLITDSNSDDYDAVVLPGGVINADALRINQAARHFVSEMHEGGKTVAAICHAPWVLISAGAIDGQTVTSFPSLQDDLRNAGATWVDKEVVIDGNLITSRNPNDIPAFSDAIIDVLSET